MGLIDLRTGPAEAAFRLAGTRLHEIYGQEITGLRADDVFSGDAAPYWRRVHDRVAEGRLRSTAWSKARLKAAIISCCFG